MGILNTSKKRTELAVQIKFGRKTVLGDELEKELLRHILKIGAKFYGLTRSMAYRLFLRSSIKPFDTNAVGKA